MTRPFRFLFDERKATQTAAYFVSRWPNQAIDKLALVKLLYHVERESLNDLGRPVFGDVYFSLDHGPIVSQALDLMKTNLGDPDQPDGYWLEHIQKGIGNEIKLVVDPGTDDLAPIELRIIDRVYQHNRGKSTSQLRRESHDLPEYQEPAPSSRIPIAAEEILAAQGKTDDEIEEIGKKSIERMGLRRIFCR